MPVTPPPSSYFFQIPAEQAGMRLDHFLVRAVAGTSRSNLGKHIRAGHILVNGNRVKPGCKLHASDTVNVDLPAAVQNGCTAQPINFDVLFEDDHLAVISKPPGLVVHPAAGHADRTLVNGLLHRYADLPGLADNRPGIVHRLDKDTSGIMLIARTEKMQRQLAAAFKNRQINKTYHALLLRSPADPIGRIVAPVGRHPVNRKKMAVRHQGGRYAASRWNILETFANGLCLAEIVIETGRTHQIRVHLSSLGAHVAGDVLYGGRVSESLGLTADRQMLHASTLSFIHPENGQECKFTAPLWEDMDRLLSQLRREKTSNGKS